MNGAAPWIAGIAAGLVSSLLASFVFVYAIRYVRPKIAISSHIAKRVLNGTDEYYIKIVNLSKRDAVNVHAELLLLHPRIDLGGVVYETTTVPLRRSSFFELKGYDKKDREGLYAIRFTIYEDLEKIWGDDEHTFLTFSIYCSDALSGVGRAFSQQYRVKRHSIVTGTFGFGTLMDIR